MNVREFAEQLTICAPRIQDLVSTGMPEDIARMFSKSYQLKRVNDNAFGNQYDILDDLYENYDFSDLELGMLTFSYPEKLSDSEFIIGHLEADYIVINTVTKEIYIKELAEPSHILMYCAQNPSAFLEALLIASCFKAKKLLKLVDDEFSVYKNEDMCIKAAGGSIYKSFCSTMLGTLG